MSTDAYELVALTARYFFAALMLLIVLRAARLTVVDSRRAAKLRRLSPMTGVCGELVVLEGDGRARRGMRYPVIREGMIGSSGRADVRIRHKSVRRRHAFFQMTRQGLKLRDHANARLRDAEGNPVRELTLGDGGEFIVGRIRLLLVLNDASAAPSERRAGEPDEFFGVDPYDAGLPSAPRRVSSAAPEEYELPGESRMPRRASTAAPEEYDFPGESRMPRRVSSAAPEEYELPGESRIPRETPLSNDTAPDERRVRMERREEFRQAMRPGDALERRTAVRTTAPRRGGIPNPRTTRRVSDFDDGIAAPTRRTMDFDDGIAGTSRRAADFNDGITGTSRRTTDFDDGIMGTTRRVSDFDDGIATPTRRVSDFDDGIASPARRPINSDATLARTPRRSRSGERGRRDVLPPEDLFLNDEASDSDDEDW